MRIRWENIFILALIVLLVVLLPKMPMVFHWLRDDLSTAYRGRGDPAIQLMKLGLVCVTATCIARLIWGNRH